MRPTSRRAEKISPPNPNPKGQKKRTKKKDDLLAKVQQQSLDSEQKLTVYICRVLVCHKSKRYQPCINLYIGPYIKLRND